MKAGQNLKTIAQILGRHLSTISREVRRNAGLRGYRPRQAEILSQQRAQASRNALQIDPVTRKIVDLVSQAIITSLAPLAQRVRTVTYDNGKEFSDRTVVDEALKPTIYFKVQRKKIELVLLLGMTPSSLIPNSP